MTAIPSEPLLLTADADLSALERTLLENTALNYSRDEASALCTTLSVIKKGSPLLRFNLRALTLLPPASERQIITPSEKVLEYLAQLSISSRDAASGLITSSLVAGRRSEAEDHGDVAFWVGVVDESRIAESILETLRISPTNEVNAIEARGGQPLSSLNMINYFEFNAATRTLRPAVELLNKLDKVVEYRTLIPGEDSLVLYICAGTFDGEWCGLLGVSVESD